MRIPLVEHLDVLPRLAEVGELIKEVRVAFVEEIDLRGEGRERARRARRARGFTCGVYMRRAMRRNEYSINGIFKRARAPS